MRDITLLFCLLARLRSCDVRRREELMKVLLALTVLRLTKIRIVFLLELEILTVVFLVGQLLLQQVISIHLQQISLVESCLA